MNTRAQAKSSLALLKEKMAKQQSQKQQKQQGSTKQELPPDVAPINLQRPDLHFRIRRGIDPAGKYLSDEQLQRILRIAHYDIKAAAHRAYMYILHQAQTAKNATAVASFRQSLLRFERGELNI